MRAVKISLVGVALMAFSFSLAAQDGCDTLKWKSLKTDYGGMTDGNSFYRIGTLDGVVINIDTLPHVYIKYAGLNISNDTFFIGETVSIAACCLIYTDTGFVGTTGWRAFINDFKDDISPNGTMYALFGSYFNLPGIVNSIKETKDIELEDISSWQVIIGIGATSKDGYYSDSVFYAGADTSTFRVVRGGVGIAETDNYPSLRVYPNPATGQLTIDNGQLIIDNVEIYSVVGQKLNNYQLSTVNSQLIIDVSGLASGMYFLKINNQVVKFIKE